MTAIDADAVLPRLTPFEVATAISAAHRAGVENAARALSKHIALLEYEAETAAEGLARLRLRVNLAINAGFAAGLAYAKYEDELYDQAREWAACQPVNGAYAAKTDAARTKITEALAVKKEELLGKATREVSEMAMFHGDGKFLVGRLDGRPLRDGEPVFAFRGQDRLLPDVLDDYARRCTEAGSPPAHIGAVLRLRDRVADWQRENGSKIPD